MSGQETERIEKKTERGQTARPVDRYSFELGVMDGFCEMVSAGVKTMAMSHPWDTKEEREIYTKEVMALCKKYRVNFYPEEDLLLTDLFPEEVCRGKFLFLFYRTEETLERYLKLKEKRALLEAGRLAESNSRELAWAFGRLLSYPEDGIERRLAHSGQSTADGSQRMVYNK